MKNFTKLLAVATALFAFACTTDTTEDLGVELGGKTTLTLSLDDTTKTYLGEKADNAYPLYWSEGDQISVNGVVSEALTEGGSANATFTFNGVLDYPYCVIYPANSANEVTFPATQEYTAGTFSAGSVPMYGYAESADDAIQIQHLIGVLRFAISGEATLSSIVLEAEEGNLAGTYSVDCTTGALTAVSTSKSVTLTFGEGLALGTEPTPIYVAVPAGTYGAVSATIYATSGEKMVVKFDTTAKPVAAGKVREFGEFKYSGVLSDEVLIDSVDALVKFAANPSKDARVTANLDLTGVEWSSIEGFAHTFDGGNFEIKGLTAPLFGATIGSFKNVKLTDINIVETENPTVGALARIIDIATEDSPVIENCSVAGKLTVNVVNFKPTTGEVSTDAATGGLVGFVRGVTIRNCVSNMEMDIQQICSSTTAVTVISSVGGIVGCLATNNTFDIPGIVEDCESKGAIKYANGAYSTSLKMSPRVAGIVGWASTSTFSRRLTNRGAVTANTQFNSDATNNFGGIVGYAASATIQNSKNYGAISCAGGRYGALHIGGVAGNVGGCAIANCENHGAVSTAKGVKHHDLLCGGVFARHTGYSAPEFSIASDCTNYAPVTVNSDMEGLAADEAFHVGGAVGWSQNNDIRITNDAKGVVTVKSALYNAEVNAYNISIGGCVAYQTQLGASYYTNNAPVNIDCTLTTSEEYTAIEKVRFNAGGSLGFTTTSSKEFSHIVNNGDITAKIVSVGDIRLGGALGQNSGGKLSNIKNTGNVTIKAGSSAGYILDIAGITPCTTGAINESSNTGDITIEDGISSGKHYCCIAGGVSYTTGVLTGITNSGNISVTNMSSGKTFQVAGGVAWSENTLTNITNSGNITVSGGQSGTLSGVVSDDKIANIAGCVAWLQTKKTLDGLTNSGTISVSKLKTNHTIAVSGCHARFNNAENIGGSGKNYKNTGAITIDNETNTSGGCYVGGCLALHMRDGSGSLTSSENDAPITVKAKVSGNTYIGGVVGYIDGSTEKTLTNGKNGDILVELASIASGKIFAVGGVAGRMVDHCVPMTNYGDVTIKGTINTNVYAGGLVAYPNNYNRRNMTNDATITIDAEVTGWCRVGGMCGGGEYAGVYTNCHNSGLIHFTKNAKISGAAYIGGLHGDCSAAGMVINGCSNSANILFEGTSGTSGAEDASLTIGGLIGNCIKLRSVQHDFTNSGNITFSGTHLGGGAIEIGGIFGHNEAPLIGEAFAVYDENGVEISAKDARPSGPIYHECKVTNIGKITCTGAHTDNTYIGGLVGRSVTGFCNGLAFCEIEALNYPNVGMLTGSAYSTEEATAFTNCHAGGQVTVKSYFNEDQDDYVPQTNTLTKDNYRIYIFGSSITNEEAQANKLGYISSVDATPIYSTGAAVE